MVSTSKPFAFTFNLCRYYADGDGVVNLAELRESLRGSQRAHKAARALIRAKQTPEESSSSSAAARGGGLYKSIPVETETVP